MLLSSEKDKKDTEPQFGRESAVFDTFYAEKKANKEQNKLKMRLVALGSSLLGVFIFFSQQLQPASGVALLHAMEKDSIPLEQAVCNSKPTIIEFYKFIYTIELKFISGCLSAIL